MVIFLTIPKGASPVPSRLKNCVHGLDVYKRQVLKIDDPVGASSVHGVCGFLGTVLTGLFSTSEGLFYGHGAGFLGAQLFGAVVVGVWAAGMGFIIFKVLDKIHGLRVPARVEAEGLQI